MNEQENKMSDSLPIQPILNDAGTLARRGLTSPSARGAGKEAAKGAGKEAAKAAGKEGAKIAGKLSGIDFIMLKFKITIIVTIVLLLFLRGCTALFSSIVTNEVLHMNDPEILNEAGSGRDENTLGYYGTADENLEAMLNQVSDVQDETQDIVDEALELAKESLKDAASPDWILDWVIPDTTITTEETTMFFSSYCISVNNGVSEHTFEYYQEEERDADKDYVDKMKPLLEEDNLYYPFGNYILGADFERDESGNIIIREVPVTVYIDGVATTIIELHVTAIVYDMVISDVVEEAFNFKMDDDYVEDRDVEPGATNIADESIPYSTTYSQMIMEQCSAMSNLLYGDETFQGTFYWSQYINNPNGTITEIALSQLGNNYQLYNMFWNGSATRYDWCAYFVSWVGYQAGYVDLENLHNTPAQEYYPSFARVDTGREWFIDNGRYSSSNSGYVPVPGDLIFFDWASDGRDGKGDHVGIVVAVENGRVYTVEGNSGSGGATSTTVREKSYDLGSADILGYGTPAYTEADARAENE